MKKQYILPVLLILFVACQPAKDKTEESEKAATEQESQEVVSDDGEREPTDDEIRELGLIKAIEDTGYPMFYIDVEFPERNMTISFNFNVEENPLNVEQVMAMKDKYATIYYITEDALQLADVLYQDKTVLGEYGLDDFDGFDKANGTLSGADEPTPGDLPGTITVTTNDGQVLSFEYFVTDEMVAVNKKEVTVYYYEQGMNKITYLKASED